MFEVECRDESRGIYGSKWETVATEPTDDNFRRRIRTEQWIRSAEW